MKRLLYCIGLVVLFFICYYFLTNPLVSSYTLEIGTEFDYHEILKNKDNEIKVDYQNSFTNELGSHKVLFHTSVFPYFVTIDVVDTIPPQVDVHDVSLWIGDKISPDLFVSVVNDHTKVTSSFKDDVSIDKVGRQNVTLVFTDEGNNQTEKTAILTLKVDNEPPTITGIQTILSNVGETISYKKYVQVSDNRDDDIEVSVDSSQVNYNKPGEYYVTYKAKYKI